MAAGAVRHRSIRTAFLGSLAGAVLSMFLKFLPVIKALTTFLANQVIRHFLLLSDSSQWRNTVSCNRGATATN
jgi:hypothetical protein